MHERIDFINPFFVCYNHIESITVHSFYVQIGGNMEKYMDYLLQQVETIMKINSPSGYTKEVIDYLANEFDQLGFSYTRTIKGGLVVDYGGNDANNAIMVGAHCDTLGAMIHEIKADGRIKLTAVGGLNANNIEAENCTIITKFDGEYEGTCQLINASIHVNGHYNEILRTYDTVEVVLDEDVHSKEDVEKLGIGVGDFVCFETRTRVTKSGYIKSRFLDDKLSVAILLAYAKYLKDEHITPERKVYAYFSVYEEVGHGAAASMPDGVTESISIDMGCVGEGLQCTEKQVSICAKDRSGPYNYEVVKGLISAAKENNVDYKVDIYPFYGSDVDVTLKAGYDIKHGLIGPGVYASHGYERSHKDGALNTLKLLQAYIG